MPQADMLGSWSHLLQQDGVVSLKCLKDVVVAAHLTQPVDGSVAVPAR
jgi:hypothetical protein